MSALLFAKIGSLDNAREAYSGATAFNFQPNPCRSGVLVSSGSHTKESRLIGPAAVRNLMTVALKVLIRFA